MPNILLGYYMTFAHTLDMTNKYKPVRGARAGHDIKTFASPAAGATQWIKIRRSQSVRHPRALRDPSAASASGYPVGYPTCLESRYQAFIASRNRITLVCPELDLVLTVHATTIIIAFEFSDCGGMVFSANCGMQVDSDTVYNS